DLSLVMVHGQDGVEGAGPGAQEDGIGWEGSVGGDAAGLGLLDGRGDDVDLLAAEVAAIAGVRVEAGDGDARPGEAGLAHGAVGEDEAVDDGLAGDEAGDVPEWHVRGDAGVPEALEDVELAGRAVGAELLSEEGDLVLIGGVGQAHGGLVEGSEGDGLGMAGGGIAQGGAEVGDGEGAALAADLAEADGGRVEVAEIDEDGPA